MFHLYNMVSEHQFQQCEVAGSIPGSDIPKIPLTFG